MTGGTIIRTLNKVEAEYGIKIHDDFQFVCRETERFGKELSGYYYVKRHHKIIFSYYPALKDGNKWKMYVYWKTGNGRFFYPSDCTLKELFESVVYPVIEDRENEISSRFYNSKEN